MNKRLKQKLINLLRKANLLGLADYLLFIRESLKQRAANKAFKRNNPEVKTPPLHILFDAMHICSFQGYFESGKPHAQLVINTIRNYKPNSSLAILEWGCGPARVIQHLSKIDNNLARIVGADYNPETIKWCRESFSDIEFCLNELAPPLPYEAHSFDAIYAISVFTHLSEAMHYAWIKEIVRLLKPGGLLFVTLHSEKKIGSLLPDELNRFNNGQIIVRENVQEGKKHFLAYHSENFVRNKLLVPFSKVDRIDAPEMHQDVWVAITPLVN